MNKHEFFTSLGFTDYEAKALASLTKLKVCSVKEIALDSNVPQNKLYQIIKRFEQEGLASLVPGEIKKYKIINLKTYIKEQIVEKEKQIKDIKKSSISLEDLEDSLSHDTFSIIRGQQAILNKLSEQNQKVKGEILGVQRNWKVWGNGLRAMQKCTRRGVKVKIIGMINEETKSRALEWKKVGCKIKAYNSNLGPYPLRFSIFDNKEARITIGKPEIQDPKNYITIWTSSKPLISLLRNQFNQMWKSSKTF